MPYNPGVQDISGQLLARGMENAAQARAQGIGAIGGAISNLFGTYAQKRQQDEEFMAKAKSMENFIKTHADDFAPVDPQTGQKNPDAVLQFLQQSPDENAKQKYMRLGTFLDTAVTGTKVQQQAAAAQYEKTRAALAQAELDEIKKALAEAEAAKLEDLGMGEDFGGKPPPSPSARIPSAAASGALPAITSYGAGPIAEWAAATKRGVPAALSRFAVAPVATGGPAMLGSFTKETGPEAYTLPSAAATQPALLGSFTGTIPGSMTGMPPEQAAAAEVAAGQVPPAEVSAQTKLETIKPVSVDEAAKALGMLKIRKNMPAIMQQQRLMQRERETQAREQRAAGVLYNSEEDAQAAADQFNEDPKNVGIVAMVQPDATRGGFAVKKQTTSLKTPAQEAATAAAVEEAKLTTQRAGELNTKIAQEALDAAQDRPRLQRIKELYRAGAQSGFGQDWLITSKGILATLGFGDASKIKDGQELQALLEKDAFSQAQRYLKGGGSISNQERASMSKISQSFNKVEGANLALINMTEAAYNKSEAAENYRAGLEQQPGMDERKIAAAMRVWIRDPKNSLERFAPRDSGIPPKGTVVIQKGVKYVSDGFTMTQIN